MLGFGATGQFALGQFAGTGTASTILVGVEGTGFIGTLGIVTGGIPAVFGTGAVGIIVPSTLTVNLKRLLANTVRRLRTLGINDPRP